MNKNNVFRFLKVNIWYYLIFGLILFLIVYFYNFYVNKYDKKINDIDYILSNNVSHSKEITLDNINTSSYNLMIVAHPDDESFWGSRELYNKKYLVVCITCGTDSNRIDEFKETMNFTNDDYIMLGYVDLDNGRKSDWQLEYKYIEEDINKVLFSKDWEMVLTHNPEGEYGHIHHKLTNKIVTENSNKENLYYFGRFYHNDIPKGLNRLTNEEYEFKKNILVGIYKSQRHVFDDFEYMSYYEDVIKYDRWFNEQNKEYS